MIDWDQWRADYHRLSFADQVLFYREAAAAYPEQASYDWAVVDGVLGSLDPGSVLELGGWDGGLAGRALAEHPWISSWVNVDLADVPQVCQDQRYRRVLLDDWFWRRQWHWRGRPLQMTSDRSRSPRVAFRSNARASA